VVELLAFRQDEKEPLAHRRRLPALGAVEEGSLHLIESVHTDRWGFRSPSGGGRKHPPAAWLEIAVRRGTRSELRARVPMPSVYIETYGCQMNLADTELMRGHLARSGYATAADPATADVILLNTCAIREHAEERIVGRVGTLAQFKLRR